MKKAAIKDDPGCLFCELIAGRLEASIIEANERVLAVIDVRQFHPGHVLVMPRRHIPDIRVLDRPTGTALMRMAIEMARVVDRVFPSDGLSVWHSAGAGANQEVPHLHIHIHPRRIGDDLLRVYPAWAPHPSRQILDEWALRLNKAVSRSKRQR
jgi:histidine triad (HIT) family protein